MTFFSVVVYKALSAALTLSVCFFLSVYLVLIVLSIVLQYAFIAFSKTELHSLFESLFLFLCFNSAHTLHCV